jgi:MoxR-like ATPase
LGLFRAGQALAAIQGETSVSRAQIDSLIEIVLAHRLVLRAEQKDRWKSGTEVIRELVGSKADG